MLTYACLYEIFLILIYLPSGKRKERMKRKLLKKSKSFKIQRQKSKAPVTFARGAFRAN
jgi:hypothetical protein